METDNHKEKKSMGEKIGRVICGAYLFVPGLILLIYGLGGVLGTGAVVVGRYSPRDLAGLEARIYGFILAFIGAEMIDWAFGGRITRRIEFTSKRFQRILVLLGFVLYLSPIVFSGSFSWEKGWLIL